MLLVAGPVAVPPEHHAELLAATRRVVASTLTEPGCLRYGFWADPERAGRLLVFEEWESEADLEAHLQAPHLKEFQAELGRLGLLESAVRRYRVEAVRPR